MNYAVVTTKFFDKEVKNLSKKYRSLSLDLENLKKELLANPTMGDKISDDVRKVRMAIASKGKGKSGGARVITCTVLIDVRSTKIYLLTIYDKSGQITIAKSTIEHLKQKSGLG